MDVFELRQRLIEDYGRPVPLFDPLPDGGLPVIETDRKHESLRIRVQIQTLAGSRTVFTPAAFRIPRNAAGTADRNR